jgi:hypothetical protein
MKHDFGCLIYVGCKCGVEVEELDLALADRLQSVLARAVEISSDEDTQAFYDRQAEHWNKQKTYRAKPATSSGV